MEKLQMFINQIVISPVLLSKWEGNNVTKDNPEMIEEINKNISTIKEINLWWEKNGKDELKWIKKEFDRKNSTVLQGLSNILIEFKWKENYVKLIGKYNYSFQKQAMEFFAFNFSLTKSPSKNGVVVENIATEMLKSKVEPHVELLWSEKDNYVVEFNDNVDIQKALLLYSRILSEEENEHTTNIKVSDFKMKEVLIVDSSITTEKSLNSKIEIRKVGKKNVVSAFFAEDTEVKKYLLEVAYSYEISIENKVFAKVKKTLDDIKKFGEIYLSKNLSINLDRGEANITTKLIESNFKRVNDKHGELELLVKEIITPAILGEGGEVIEQTVAERTIGYYFHIANVPNMIKNKTVLRVLKDIEKNQIKNNDIFQYLFNNGKFPQNKKIANWKFDLAFSEKAKEKLNDAQKSAFDICVDDFPIAFIQGPPGTGKTHLIKELVKYYTKLGETVLISSQTNVAVENVLQILWDDPNYQNIPLKIESGAQSSFSLQKVSKEIMAKIEKITNWDLTGARPISPLEAQSPSKYKVIGSTTTSSSLESHHWLEWMNSNRVLIIDEISKCTVPELIRYSISADKLIFIGDQKQLSPMQEIEDDILEKYGDVNKKIMSKYIMSSVFAGLYDDMERHSRTVMLNQNYRSLPIITSVYSKFYDDKLIPMRSSDSSSIVWNDENNIYPPLTFVANNNATEGMDGTSRYNMMEVDLIFSLIKDLSKKIVNAKNLSVAVISHYGAQVHRIATSGVIAFAKANFKSIKVDTVDSFQGDQADIVIFSSVLTDTKKGLGFIQEYRRLNVALSRAKDLLIIIGSDFVLQSINYHIDGKSILLFEYILNLTKSDKKNSKFIIGKV